MSYSDRLGVVDAGAALAGARSARAAVVTGSAAVAVGREQGKISKLMTQTEYEDRTSSFEHRSKPYFNEMFSKSCLVQ